LEKTANDWEPKNWRALWEGIAESNKRIVAPVELLGAEKMDAFGTGKKGKDDKEEANRRAYHTLVGLMLSA